jgi:hypothetical protein
VGRLRSEWQPTARIAAATIATAGVALVVSACGGSSGSHVAQLSSTATRSSSTPAAASQQSGAVAFSGCVRSHVVPAYPDPSSGGLLSKKTPHQLGVSSSALQAAETACQHLLPSGGGGPTPAQVAQYRDVMLIYALCMRAHGVLNMPDPDSRGRLAIGPGTDVPVNTPQFQAAFGVCKSKLSYYQSP